MKNKKEVVHFEVKSEADGSFILISTGCGMYKSQSLIKAETNRRKVTCGVCKKSELFKNKNLVVI